MNRLALLLVSIFMLSTLVSCGGGSSPSSSSSPTSPAAIAVSVSGPSTVAAGGSATFTASVTNTSNTAVSWEVNGTTAGNSTVGTISAGGVYTAPNLPLSGGTVTIAAVSQADSTKSGSATVAIQFSNVSVNGPYAFSFGGANANGEFSLAGDFRADGNGTITNGLEDLNGAGGVFTDLAFSGTYAVGPDGRGSATIMSSQGSTNFHFVTLASGQVQIVEFDASETGNGTAIPQDTSSLSLSAVAGSWSFFLSGTGPSGEPVAGGGCFSLDSAGNLTSGVADYNYGGTVSSNFAFTGTATTVASSGRGTVSFTGSLGISNYAFYVASANEVLVIETDSTPALAGTAFKQQSASFANSSLAGNYVYELIGTTTLGASAEVGQVILDGSGNIKGGSFDVNDDGNALLDQSLAGTYSVGPNGRGTASVSSTAGTTSIAFYLISQNLAVFVETDSSAVAEGLARAQTGGPFSDLSASGHFGFDLVGVTTAGGINSVGQLVSNGSGNLTAVEDVNEAGTLATGVNFSGTYSVSSTGRATATLTSGGVTSNFVFYIASPAEVLFVETDPGEVITGFAAAQF